MKVLLAVLLALLFALQMRLWFGDGSLQELSRLRDEAEHSRNEVRRLTIRNQALNRSDSDQTDSQSLRSTVLTSPVKLDN